MQTPNRTLHLLPDAIQSLLQFSQKVGWIFRGQVDSSWSLLPGAGRSPFHVSSHPINPSLPSSRRNPPRDLGRFNHWRELASAYCRTLPTNDFDCLAFAQHYGLPTRLLDFTENAIAALYFACAGKFDLDGAVYAYCPRLYVDRERADLYAIPVNACLRVPPFDERILAQRGVFVLFADPAQALSAEKLEEEHLKLNCGTLNLVKLVIPAASKLIIHRQLQEVGMTHRTLFPDLEGLSRDFVAEALYLEAFRARTKEP